MTEDHTWANDLSGKTKFDYLNILSKEDQDIAISYVGCCLPFPNVILAPDGEPYLYRWHIFYDNKIGNTFFHVQVKSDPERPFHDHPWDNTSLILAGGYTEHYSTFPRHQDTTKLHSIRSLEKGDFVMRGATTAHRLILPPEFPYAMTLFSTGPKTRPWGFWYPGCDWHHNERHVVNRAEGGVSNYSTQRRD